MENNLLRSIAIYCQMGFAVLAVVIMIAAINWNQITSLLIENDLRHYAQSVRTSTISLEEKERLLDLIEGLEDRIEEGEQMDWWRWHQHDQIIRAMLDKSIESEEVRLIEREIKRIK